MFSGELCLCDSKQKLPIKAPSERGLPLKTGGGACATRSCALWYGEILPFVPQAPSVTLRVPPPSRREAKITPFRHIKPTDKSKFEIDKLMFIGVLYPCARKTRGNESWKRGRNQVILGSSRLQEEPTARSGRSRNECSHSGRFRLIRADGETQRFVRQKWRILSQNPYPKVLRTFEESGAFLQKRPSRNPTPAGVRRSLWFFLSRLLLREKERVV